MSVPSFNWSGGNIELAWGDVAGTLEYQGGVQPLWTGSGPGWSGSVAGDSVSGNPITFNLESASQGMVGGNFPGDGSLRVTVTWSPMQVATAVVAPIYAGVPAVLSVGAVLVLVVFAWAWISRAFRGGRSRGGVSGRRSAFYVAPGRRPDRGRGVVQSS